MKTFKQILSEARAPAKPKGPPKEMQTAPDKSYKEVENNRGVPVRIINLGQPVEKSARKVLDKSIDDEAGLGSREAQDMMKRKKELGAFITPDSASVWDASRLSHGAAKEHTVGGTAATFSYSGRDKLSVRVHGDVDNATREMIEGHPILNSHWKTVTVAKD